MHRTILPACVLLLAALWSAPASPWASANRFGGHSSGTAGQGFTHENAYGGTTSGRYGEGATHTNVYGGTTSGRYGEGATHTNVYGGTTSGAYGEGATHTYAGGGTVYRPPGAPAYAYPAYHPPVAVPYYAASGCYGCAAAAGAVVGVTAGAAVASANASNAYAAGVAAGSASTAAAMSYVQGVNYAALPAGCVVSNVPGGTYYACGNTWFQPYYGANGVYYRVVPAP